MMSKIWRAQVGTCQGCNRVHPLDDGRHVHEHMRWQDHRCSGSGKLAVEARAANAEVSQQRALVRLDKLRADAAIAHDALLSFDAKQFGGVVPSSPPFPAHRILELRKAALQEYRIKFPKARANRLWFVVGRGSRRGNRWGAAKCDVFCTLCKEVLITRADRGWDYTERTREHTTLCAMKRLAGMAEYVAPGEKRMPADAVRPEAF